MSPSADSRWLLLDLGNSRLKWAWTAGDTIGPVRAAVHGRDPWSHDAEAAWRGSPPPQRILLAAVAAESVLAAVREALARCLPAVAVELIASPAGAGAWRSAYAEPGRLGVDRYLAMRGAMALHAGAVLVAGCGTALALDVVDADGAHRGGLIAPGPALMREAVLARAGRVGWQREGRVLDLASDTEDAVQSGCWLAAAALIERTRATAAGALGAAPALVLHGGDAERLAALLAAPATVAPAVVFEGMLRHAR